MLPVVDQVLHDNGAKSAGGRQVHGRAMAVLEANFDSWLSTKLQELKTDESVFGAYIKGILEGYETEDEKTEALEGILAGITEDDIEKHVNEILAAWAKWSQVEDAPVDNAPKEDVDVRLIRMLESQNLPTTSHKSNHTEEEKRIKEAILAQYSQMSDEEESEGEGDKDGAGAGGGGGGGGGGGFGDCGIEKNTNAATIAQAEREKREIAKQESQKKKDKDKEDREKQKLLKEEKKEKRKTQKGERRR